jgi:hypothetical protein
VILLFLEFDWKLWSKFEYCVVEVRVLYMLCNDLWFVRLCFVDLKLKRFSCLTLVFFIISERSYMRMEIRMMALESELKRLRN